MPDFLKCPFCGKSDIEFGLALCAGCYAEIEYDAQDIDTDPIAETKLYAAEAEAEALAEKAEKQPSILAYFTMKRALSISKSVLDARQTDLDRAMKSLASQKARGDYTSEVAFSRGEKVIKVAVYIPPNPNFVDKPIDLDASYEVILNSLGKKKADVTRVVKSELKVGLIRTIKILETLPTTILVTGDYGEAEALRAKLRNLGGDVEIVERAS